MKKKKITFDNETGFQLWKTNNFLLLMFQKCECIQIVSVSGTYSFVACI